MTLTSFFNALGAAFLYFDALNFHIVGKANHYHLQIKKTRCKCIVT